VCGLTSGTCTSSEKTGFFENNKKQEVLRKGNAWGKKKFLKAFLDVAIMAEMAQRSAMSAMDIIVFFENKCNFRISPGTIYPILYKLEKNEYIKKLPNRVKGLYELTDSGKQKLKNLKQSMAEVQSLIIELINK
jgi:DNA-binding PadR family transcriptional regulator